MYVLQRVRVSDTSKCPCHILKTQAETAARASAHFCEEVNFALADKVARAPPPLEVAATRVR